MCLGCQSAWRERTDKTLGVQRSSLAAIPFPAPLRQSAWWGAGFCLLAEELGHMWCKTREKQFPSEARCFSPKSTAELSRDRNEKWKVNILAPRPFWQTRDCLWMCHEKLSRRTPEPNISEVTSSFGKLGCDVPSLRKRNLNAHLVRNQAPVQGWEEVTQTPHPVTPHIQKHWVNSSQNCLVSSQWDIPARRFSFQHERFDHISVWDFFFAFLLLRSDAFSKIAYHGKSVVLSLILFTLSFLMVRA